MNVRWVAVQAVLCVLTLSHGTHDADYAVYMLLIITVVLFLEEDGRG